MLEFRSHLRILPTKVVQIGFASSGNMSHPFFQRISQRQLTGLGEPQMQQLLLPRACSQSVNLVGYSMDCERPTETVVHKSNITLEVYERENLITSK